MSRKARTLRILQNVNFNLEHSDTEIDTYTVQDNGTLQKENEDPSPPIITGPPQNIYIFRDGSVHSRSGRSYIQVGLVIHTIIVHFGLSLKINK